MSSKAGSYDTTSRKKDHITRGVKSTSWPGILTFIGLRAADPFLQYGILAKGWGSTIITTLGGTILPQGPALLTGTAIDKLGLSPYRSVLLAMSVGSMLKHNIHVATLMQERVEPPFGVMIGAFNAVCNSLNDLFFICAQTSASANGQPFPQTPLLVGSALFLSGIAIELGSEVQRHNFKKDPRNKGKVYTGGLFSLSRHINYFGYTLWRAGYALAGGGWTWAAAVTAYFVIFFAKNSIPLLQHYLEDRYGEQYEKYKRDVPYALIPYVW